MRNELGQIYLNFDIFSHYFDIFEALKVKS